MFVALWEFEVKPGDEERFERAYGADGDWAELFRSGRGYLETRLARELGRSRVYMTIDAWETREAYDGFKKEHAEEYARMDREFEGMTLSERKIGEFES